MKYYLANQSFASLESLAQALAGHGTHPDTISWPQIQHRNRIVNAVVTKVVNKPVYKQGQDGPRMLTYGERKRILQHLDQLVIDLSAERERP